MAEEVTRLDFRRIRSHLEDLTGNSDGSRETFYWSSMSFVAVRTVFEKKSPGKRHVTIYMSIFAARCRSRAEMTSPLDSSPHFRASCPTTFYFLSYFDINTRLVNSHWEYSSSKMIFYIRILMALRQSIVIHFSNCIDRIWISCIIEKLLHGSIWLEMPFGEVFCYSCC
jgi:hypothetical protein